MDAPHVVRPGSVPKAGWLMAEQAQPTRTIALPRWQPYALLIVGVSAISTAALLVRLGQDEGAPSLLLAAARLVIASLALAPAVFVRHRPALRAVSRRDLFWTALAGLMLGLHFASWIQSLEYTSVVNSVVLVTTSPLWVALLSPVFLKEPLHRWTIAGLLLALAGGTLVGLAGDPGDAAAHPHAMWGNGLALFGAWMIAAYFTIGRRVRTRLNVMVYTWLVYTAGAGFLIGVIALGGVQVGGLPGKAYLWMLLMGLIPQLIGHSLLNYALGFLPAAYVSLIVLGEPIGSGVLAFTLLGEVPAALQIAGSGLILGGIILATRDRDLEKNGPEG